ncbi:hypothetical protein HU200_054012 [Digitaria exilis]|uniref:GRAS family transcription factor n=1 Tax=Digitaria exilis TaxID=1010633 RepID=A0A835AR66_9POAL|nr:hypothetical protein HU200_054012 [Digitaria exilis]
MTTTPEEFFAKGLMEQSPPSPPVFLDIPQKPSGSSDSQHQVPDNMMLPHILRVLFEDENIDDKLSDDPALLQVQQPFAQILSCPPANTRNKEGSNNLLQDICRQERALDLVLSKSNEVVQAFLKGMEDANRLLPKDNYFRRDNLVNRIVTQSSSHSGAKKRYNMDDHQEEARASKAILQMKEVEDNSANNILDEMMLQAYQTCIWGMDKLCVTMENKNRNCSGRKASRNDVVDVRALLISCAEAVAANDHMRACELLNQIKKHASETGDATQRLAQCFTNGLEARLKGGRGQISQLLIARPSFMDFLEAYNLYFRACCFNGVTFIFSIMTIMKYMVGKSRLHIVDYGMCFGFQWAGLLRLLATREGGLPEVKITAIGPPKPKSYPAERIEEIGCRLRKCADKYGLPPFKFHIVMKKWEDVCIKDLSIEIDEVLVVNDLFNFSSLMDESVLFDDPSPRDIVLNNIKKMKPDVFIQSIVNCSYGSSFLTRFRETMFYYMALFDILDATIPRESKSRLVLEQFVLGSSALNAIASEGVDLVEHPEKYRQWQARNQRIGLRLLPLKSRIIKGTVRMAGNMPALAGSVGLTYGGWGLLPLSPRSSQLSATCTKAPARQCKSHMCWLSGGCGGMTRTVQRGTQQRWEGAVRRSAGERLGVAATIEGEPKKRACDTAGAGGVDHQIPGEVYGGARGEHDLHSPCWGNLVEEPHGDANIGVEVLEEGQLGIGMLVIALG